MSFSIFSFAYIFFPDQGSNTWLTQQRKIDQRKVKKIEDRLNLQKKGSRSDKYTRYETTR